jgi:hypothetical protein
MAPTIDGSRFDPENWKYVGEGGKHALFEFSSEESMLNWNSQLSGLGASDAHRPDKVEYNFNDTAHPNLNGWLLRLRKIDLLLSARVAMDAHQNIEIEKRHDNPKCQLYDNRYIQQVIAPALGHYVDIPYLVESLSLTGFAYPLYCRTIVSGMIPYARRHDWQLSKCEPAGTCSVDLQQGFTALLVRNYRLGPVKRESSLWKRVESTIRLPSPTFDGYNRAFHSPTSMDTSAYATHIVTVEIKPKAGYRTFSPLVHPARRCKYRMSRYSLHQQLYASGNLSKDWMNSSGDLLNPLAATQSFKRSQYNPWNLFSGERTWIYAALLSLWRVPQNNFRLWVGGKLVVGNDVSTSAISTFDQICSLCQINGCLCRRLNQFRIINILACIFDNEEVLRKVLDLQKLDYVDSDGAVQIYNQLQKVRKCHPDELDEQIDTVNHSHGRGASSFLSSWSFLKSSPILRPDTCEAHISDFFTIIDRFYCRYLTSPHMQSNIPEEAHEMARSDAMQHIQQMTDKECVFHLQNFLLSLAMCDVSIFVTMRFDISWEVQRKTCDDIGLINLIQSFHNSQTIRKQDVCHPGLVVGNDCRVMYEIKIIDIDQKPARKLRSRIQKEILLDNL